MGPGTPKGVPNGGPTFDPKWVISSKAWLDVSGASIQFLLSGA